ncbi:MAG: DNA translocase FtsK 4TM domain-containing protein, partial [Chloroflexota bacterium]
SRRPRAAHAQAPLVRLPSWLWQPAVARDILVGSLFLLGLLSSVSLVFPDGSLTAPLHFALTKYLGWCAPLAPGWMLLVSALRLWQGVHAKAQLPRSRIVGGILASLACIGLAHIVPWGDPDPAMRAAAHSGGGQFGYALQVGFVEVLGVAGATTVLLGSLALGTVLALDKQTANVARFMALLAEVTFRSGARAARGFWFATSCVSRWGYGLVRKRMERPKLEIHGSRTKGLRIPAALLRAATIPVPPPEPIAEVIEPVLDELTEPAPPGVWKLPPISLFQPSKGGVLSEVEIRERARIIEETLLSFNIEAKVVEVHQGPTVTQFGLEPAPGVAVNRILARGNDLALRMGASPIRLEAPVPGKRMVGIEAPNATVSSVNIRDIFEAPQFVNQKSRLRLALGQDVTGKPIVGDLGKMPHLLIAGATGAGKSVCINSIIASLIYQSSPDELNFVMIDPKMVELVGFNGIPHLRMPVVTDMERVVGALKWVVREMERRYAIFVEHAARNIDTYNTKIAEDPTKKKMPYLVVVIDELADMMMTAPDEVEKSLCRLAQLARATGIHLVVATQRPSVDVLTGLIKANFPTRVAFAVTSQVDSRVILDMGGAEKLLGRGDALFMPQDQGKPIRVQGAYVSDDEIQSLVKHWRIQGMPRFTSDEVQELQKLGQPEPEDTTDEMYERALEVASQYQKISISLLQRRLGIGYPRAARLVDLLEERGIVAASSDGKSREVRPSADDEE